jgi:hypothetical protein
MHGPWVGGVSWAPRFFFAHCFSAPIAARDAHLAPASSSQSDSSSSDTSSSSDSLSTFLRARLRLAADDDPFLRPATCSSSSSSSLSDAISVVFGSYKKSDEDTSAGRAKGWARPAAPPAAAAATHWQRLGRAAL